jgi:hypothetical protein
MLAVPADGAAPFAARRAGLVVAELVGRAARMGNAAALTRNLSQSVWGQDGKAAFTFCGRWQVLWRVWFHGVFSSCLSVSL